MKTYHRHLCIPYRRPPLCFTSFGVVDREDRVSMPSTITDSFAVIVFSLSSSPSPSSGASLQAHASANSPLLSAVKPKDNMQAGLEEKRASVIDRVDEG